MPAVPKKKPSLTRQHSRHSSWEREYQPDAKVACSHCGQTKRPHRVCPHCGQYRGKQTLEPKTKVRKVSGA